MRLAIAPSRTSQPRAERHQDSFRWSRPQSAERFSLLPACDFWASQVLERSLTVGASELMIKGGETKVVEAKGFEPISAKALMDHCCSALELCPRDNKSHVSVVLVSVFGTSGTKPRCC